MDNNVSQHQSKSLVALFASILMDAIGVGIVIPFLPFYAKSLEASPLEIGILIGLYPLMYIFAPILWGSLSDKIGRRPALLFNIAGTTLSFLGLSLANSLWILFIARLIAGASSASIVIAQSYISDLTTSENRTKTLGLLQAIFSIGYVIGPGIGGLLVGPDVSNPNFRLPGFAATISASLTFCLAFFTLPRLGRRPVVYSFKLREYTQHFFTDVKKSFKRPLVAKLMLLLFIGTFASMGSQAVFALWCESQLGWGAQQYGYLIIFYGLGIAIIQISAAGQLIHWLGDVRILLLGLITAAIGFLLIPFATTIPQLVGTLLFLMFSSATSNPVIASLFSQLSGAKQQGKTLGLMQSVIGLASFLGAIWAGFMFGFLGVNWPYWFSSVLVGISILFSWRQISQSRFSQIKQRQRRQKQLYLFELLDQNHDGSISLDDFQQVSKMFTHLRGEVSETNEYEILRASFIGLGELLIQIADQDGNLQVDQDEWLYFLEYQVEYDFATLFLQIIDENQDGRLTVEELRTFYRAYGIDIEELEEAFHTLDLTQSGYVSDDEFRAFFNQFLYGDDLQAPGNWLFGISLPQRL